MPNIPTVAQLPEGDYGLGRVPSPFDPRDALFAMSAAMPELAEGEVLPTFRYWTGGPVLDQGATPHCVGFAWAGWQVASPLRHPSVNAIAGSATGHLIYAACKRIDGYVGDGTYVRAGGSVMRSEGRVSRYVWAMSKDDLIRWVLMNGPVVVGTLWYQGMFYPDANGVVIPRGAVAGGHAYLVIGYNRSTKRFRLVCSWGEYWGDKGRAWISEDHLWALISAGGEAVGAVEQIPNVNAIETKATPVEANASS